MAKKSPPAADITASANKHSELRGLLFLTISLLILLSLLSFSYGHTSKNWLGLIGYTIGWILHITFGITSYLIVPFMAWLGWRRLFGNVINNLRMKIFYFVVLLFSLSMLLNLLEEHYPFAATFLNQSVFHQNNYSAREYHLGGSPLYFIYHDLPGLNLKLMLNTTGVMIVCLSTLLGSILYLCKVQVKHLLENIYSRFYNIETPPSELAPAAVETDDSSFMRYVKLRIPEAAPQFNVESSQISQQQDMLGIQPETNLVVRPSMTRKEEASKKEVITKISAPEQPQQKIVKPKTEPPLKKREAALKAQKVHNGDMSSYTLPPASLLTNAKKMDQTSLKKDLKKQAEVLEETLLSFGIEAKVGQINCGPTITSFEVHPSIGVKVQKIKALENDIALNMEAKSIRIIAPIPGKAAVGIEVPNAQAQEVGFKELLLHYQQNHNKLHIPTLLGKAVNGDIVMNDLAKMPHCIIAGATGSGKSVCINTIVMSIVMNARPDQIKLMMVDPKKVELTPYSKLPHMIAPVITEPKGACAALLWLVKEMERRYEILKQTGVRNIEAFNNRPVNKAFEEALDIEIPEKMYYIVGIIDELADLMMSASSDIEMPIARIAQMARAVGIHLILATQRPSREVITGLIKANFPTRISFKVASRVNSQIVLDEIGAESLLGNGDMLFLPPGTSLLVRAQGSFIRDEDINAVVKFICDQAPPNYLIESFDALGIADDQQEADVEGDDYDSLYEQARDIVITTGTASTTFLQRKLKIGYARAASLIDQLEKQKVIGPAEGSKPRKVLIGQETNKKEIVEEVFVDEEHI